MFFSAPEPVDYSKFLRDVQSREVLFGLPENVRYCTDCVISNQRPNSTVEYAHRSNSVKTTIAFDENGQCDACKNAAKKKAEVRWSDREKELQDLCDKFRSKDGSYDCIVPGSGGKDSFYQAHVLKYKYGMNPLTVTWAPHLYTDWGWKNFNSWLAAGFDNYLHTPNPLTHRLLTRIAVENLLHPFQPFILGQKAFAPKMANLLGISLIFYGENEAEYGNPLADNFKATRDAKFYTGGSNDHSTFLGGVDVDTLREEFGLTNGELSPYLPLELERAEESNIEVHYLGYYLNWHPQGAFYYASENGGFQPAPERTPGTYSKYNSIDDKIDDFHYLTTFVKFGIGRATYDASQEIRNGEISRDEGVALVRKFDGEYPSRFEEEIFRYLSIPAEQFPIASKKFEEPIVTRDYFSRLCDQFRSPHLWQWDDATQQWSLIHRVSELDS